MPVKNSKMASSGVQTFRYLRATLDLPVKLTDHLEANESVVLLGPRYIGKARLLNQVRRLLETRGHRHIISFDLFDRDWTSDNELRTTVLRGLNDKLKDAGWYPPPHGVLIADALADFLRHVPCHLFLFLPDVDTLPDHTARRLLKHLRSLISPAGDRLGRVTALLTGSVGLAPLVHGPGSDFNCVTQYVIQGYAEDAFCQYAYELVNATGLRFSDMEQVLLDLFRLCGGNIYFTWVILSSIIDRRRIENVSAENPVTLDEVRRTEEHLTSPGGAHVDYFLRALSRLEASPEACQMLATIFDKGAAILPDDGQAVGQKTPSTPPTEIELSGLAVRDGTRLIWASPLVAGMMAEYLSHWRLGDLFACGQNWRVAFEHYAQAASQGTLWVYSPMRRPQLPSAIRAFEVSLHAEASCGVKPLESFFLRGAHYLLGFAEMAFWRYWNSWQMLTVPEVAPAGTNELQAGTRLLESCKELKPGINELPLDLSTYGLLVGLPGRREGERMALCLSNFAHEVPLTRERRVLCDSVLASFCAAYAEANRLESAEESTRIQRHLLEAIPTILKAIAGDPTPTERAFKTAADTIREIGYRRVMFSMINAERTRIIGVFDSRAADEPDIAKLSDWPLDGSIVDVQQECVKLKQSILIHDAATHGTTAKEIVRVAGTKAAVIVPIEAHGEVVGTIHFEKTTRKMPPREEIDALEYFTRQLGEVLAVAERLSVLETAVTVSAEPLYVLDRRNRVRYLNRVAANVLGLKAGWQFEAPPYKACRTATSADPAMVKQVIDRDHPITRYVRNPDQDCWNVHRIAPIPGQYGGSIGIVCQTEDLTAIGQIMKVIQHLASATSTDALLVSLLEATHECDYSGGRLYLLDRQSGLLVGHAQYGFPQESAVASMFASSEIVLPARAEVTDSWLCFDARKPMLFCYDPSRPDRDIFFTDSGLQAHNATQPAHIDLFARRPGNFWIDVPLGGWGMNEPIGKLSLTCEEHLDPWRFEMLGILAETVSFLFVALQEREDAVRDRLAWQRKAHEEALADTLHWVKNRLVPLGLFRLNYEAVNTPPERESLSRRFQSFTVRLDQVIQRAYRMMQPRDAKPEWMDLFALIHEALNQQLPPRSFEMCCASHAIMVPVDKAIFLGVIDELVSNALKAKPTNLRINVTIAECGNISARWWVVRFKDNGPGIPAHLIDRVFDNQFSEWPGRSNVGGGFGLGFVRRAMQAHGGTARVDPSCGDGACIILELRPKPERQR